MFRDVNTCLFMVLHMLYSCGKLLEEDWASKFSNLWLLWSFYVWLIYCILCVCLGLLYLNFVLGFINLELELCN
jgi:hypothetical protein